MSNEVKRWWIDLRPHSNARAQGYSTRHSAWSRPIVRFGVNAVCVMPVKDHERVVAGLKEELEVFRNREYGLENELELKQTIATQARVIEKMKTYVQHRVDCICRAGVLQYSDSCDCGLEAIERWEA